MKLTPPSVSIEVLVKLKEDSKTITVTHKNQELKLRAITFDSMVWRHASYEHHLVIYAKDDNNIDYRLQWNIDTDDNFKVVNTDFTINNLKRSKIDVNNTKKIFKMIKDNIIKPTFEGGFSEESRKRLFSFDIKKF